MGLATGFLEIERKDRSYEPVEQRLKNYKEFVLPMAPAEVSRQGARCMDCGIPYCHNGCPVNNIIPQFNELVRRDRWKDALEVLQSTNNFPEFTGRICPAPCEASCTLNIDDNPVTIKSIECAIVDRGWQEGWIQPLVPVQKTGKRVAVVGSGPAGLSCAQQFGDPVREGRSGRRPAALRHSRLQDGEAPYRPAHAADGGRGRRVPDRRRGRRDPVDQVAARGL
jgi:glutamate synthase (NADPH/NADH) small chain